MTPLLTRDNENRLVHVDKDGHIMKEARWPSVQADTASPEAQLEIHAIMARNDWDYDTACSSYYHEGRYDPDRPLNCLWFSAIALRVALFIALSVIGTVAYLLR